MPQLLAPDDILPLATPLWQRLAPAWTVEIRRVPAAEIGGNYGSTTANTTTSRATILIDESLTGRDLAETLSHEMAHVNAWPVTELLDHGDARAVALFEPMIERFGLAAISSLARTRANRTKTPAALAREGDCMDDIALILAALRAALTSADIGAAVTALVDEIASMLPADAAGIEEPIAGEAAPAMMRRGIAKALARKTAPVVDALGPKVLKRLGAKTDSEALMMLAALQIADTQVEQLVTVDDTLQRKAAVVDTMRRTGLGRPSFYVDGADELLDEWKGGTLDELKRTLVTLKRGGTPLARPRIEPIVETGGDEIPPAVRRYAEQRGKGGDVAYMKRIAANMPNGGALPQES